MGGSVIENKYARYRRTEQVCRQYNTDDKSHNDDYHLVSTDLRHTEEKNRTDASLGHFGCHIAHHVPHQCSLHGNKDDSRQQAAHDRQIAGYLYPGPRSDNIRVIHVLLVGGVQSLPTIEKRQEQLQDRSVRKAIQLQTSLNDSREPMTLKFCRSTRFVLRREKRDDPDKRLISGAFYAAASSTAIARIELTRCDMDSVDK